METSDGRKHHVVAVMLFDMVLEMALIRFTGIYAYPGSIRSLSLFAGHWYQFPIYEAIFFGGWWGLCAVLLYFKNDKGLTWVERGVEKMEFCKRSNFRKGMVRAVAVIGFCQTVELITDLDRSKIEVQRIPKMGRKAVDSNAIFIDELFVPDSDRIGEEGKGFGYVLHSLNPERILIAVEAIGIGQDALRRATQYAKERVVFGRPIGQNQGIQHPLAERWMALEAAWLMAMKAAWLYDSEKSCGAEANTAKFLGARAGYDAALQAVLTHGGFGYAKEYHVERLLREVTVTRIAPITEQLILCFIGEKVLDLPKSY